MISKSLLIATLSFIILACNSRKVNQVQKNVSLDSISAKPENKTKDYLNDTSFVSLDGYAKGFVYDLKYATNDNFLKQEVYSCDKCLIRKVVADGLIKVRDSLLNLGYRIKFYDCYRPIDVQKKMWDIYPNGKYVANPYKSGSIHNRGGAVDITLVDSLGKELQMGTKFDHFGVEAHHSYTKLELKTLANRKLLKGVMEYFDFKSLNSEWWHYTFKGSKEYSISNERTQCN